MKRWLEILIFVALAISIHMVFFTSASRSGSEAGGSGGEVLVSIEAAPETVVELVETWERPPELQTDAQNPLAPPDTVPTDTPDIPQLDLADAPRAQMRVAIIQPEPTEEVQIDATTPPPAPKPEPEPVAEETPKIKPKPRPERPEPQTAQKADQTSVGRAQQRAAGGGGNPQAGASTAQTATISKGQRAQMRAVWGSRIRARIERNKRYPRGSRASGDVTVELTVGRDGRLLNYSLKRSSGDAALDKAALNAVARTRRFPKAPAELSGNSFRFGVTMKLSHR